MIQVRKSFERGYFNYGWLETYHTFSFGDYSDPDFHRFGMLRVLNEDWIGPGQGFPLHSHRDMEILTYVLEGSLEHRDSMGNHSVIRPGEIQRMSAGSGVTHSEFNPSAKEKVHLLQIWIIPDQKSLPPSYQQEFLGSDRPRNRLRLIASGDSKRNIVMIHQNVKVYDASVGGGSDLVFKVVRNQGLWVQMTKGRAKLENQFLAQGDGASISSSGSYSLEVLEAAEFLLFETPLLAS